MGEHMSEMLKSLARRGSSASVTRSAMPLTMAARASAAMARVGVSVSTVGAAAVTVNCAVWAWPAVGGAECRRRRCRKGPWSAADDYRHGLCSA